MNKKPERLVKPKATRKPAPAAKPKPTPHSLKPETLVIGPRTKMAGMIFAGLFVWHTTTEIIRYASIGLGSCVYQNSRARPMMECDATFWPIAEEAARADCTGREVAYASVEGMAWDQREHQCKTAPLYSPVGIVQRVVRLAPRPKPASKNAETKPDVDNKELEGAEISVASITEE